jgi:capsular polysaccharide biosynthesis protein
LLLVVITAVVGLGAGWATAPSSAPLYQSSAVLFADQQTAASNAGAGQPVAFDQLLESYCLLFPDAASSQRAVATAGVARSEEVARGETVAAIVPNSDLLRVTVTDPSAAVAARLSNGMAAELARVLSSGSKGMEPVTARVVTEAQTIVVAPSGRGRRLAEDAVLGLLVGVVLLVGWELAQGRIRRPDDVETRVGLPVLVIVPHQQSATAVTDAR